MPPHTILFSRVNRHHTKYCYATPSTPVYGLTSRLNPFESAHFISAHLIGPSPDSAQISSARSSASRSNTSSPPPFFTRPSVVPDSDHLSHAQPDSTTPGPDLTLTQPHLVEPNHTQSQRNGGFERPKRSKPPFPFRMPISVPPPHRRRRQSEHAWRGPTHRLRPAVSPSVPFSTSVAAYRNSLFRLHCNHCRPAGDSPLTADCHLTASPGTTSSTELPNKLLLLN